MLTAAEVVRQAEARGLTAIAITDHDTNDLSLKAILDEWTAKSSYGRRVEKIRGLGDGKEGLNTSTVRDDDERDSIRGNRGNDWFFANLEADNISGALDKVHDKRSNETVEEL